MPSVLRVAPEEPELENREAEAGADAVLVGREQAAHRDGQRLGQDRGVQPQHPTVIGPAAGVRRTDVQTLAPVTG